MGSIVGLLVVLAMAGLGAILSIVLRENVKIPLKKYKRIRIWMILSFVVITIPTFVAFISRLEQDYSRFPVEVFIPLFIVGVISAGLDFAYHRCPSCDHWIRHRRGSWLFEDQKHCGHCGNRID